MTTPERRDLRMWTIYAHPLDWPEWFVAREWIINRRPQRTDNIKLARTLDALRGMLPPGLIPLMRQGGDDPVIVETWL